MRENSFKLEKCKLKTKTNQLLVDTNKDVRSTKRIFLEKKSY